MAGANNQPASQPGIAPLSGSGDQGQGGAAGAAAANAAAGQPAGEGAATWYPDAHAGYAKKFNSLDDALKAGANAEKKITEQGQIISDLQNFLTTKLFPVFGSLDGYNQWLDSVIEAQQKGGGAAAGAGGQQGADGGQGSQQGQGNAEMPPEFRTAVAEFKKATAAFNKMTQAQQKQTVDSVSELAMDRFFQDNPKANAEAIEAVFERGAVQVAQPHMTGSWYAALKDAYAIAEAEAAETRNRANAAGNVEGAGGADNMSGEDMFTVDMGSFRKRLRNHSHAGTE